MQDATLIYVQRDQETLMLHRIKKQHDIHEGKWNGLGGKREIGESPEESVIRELREETGLEATELVFKGILTAPLFDEKQDWVIYIYLVTAYTGEVGPCSEGEVAWIKNEDLLTLNLREGDRHFLPLLFEPGRFSCKATYVDKQLKDIHIDRYL